MESLERGTFGADVRQAAPYVGMLEESHPVRVTRVDCYSGHVEIQPQVNL
jgi:hypothetical protein